MTGNPTGSTPPQSSSQAETSTQSTSTAPTSNETTGSSNEKCEKEGFMADKQNCKKFYRCVSNGDGSYVKYDFDCPEGTAWSQELETCDHADSVSGCAQKPTAGSDGGNESTTSTTTSTEDGRNPSTTQSSETTQSTSTTTTSST